MRQELLMLYQRIQNTPALTIDLPADSGSGCITRIDTNSFSLSSLNMKFNEETFVEGNAAKNMRLLFCRGEGVEWLTGRGPMRLDHSEACFCRSDGSLERMCYSGKSSFSFLSVSMPVERFAGLIGSYVPELHKVIDILNGWRFAISEAIQRSLWEMGSLEDIHSGLERMRLEARLLESLSLCLQAGLGESAEKHRLHGDDLRAIREIGRIIEEDPASIPDIAALAREYCMSVSKLTRSFRQVYGNSLHAYVIASRLQKGAELLTHGGFSIQEIAEIVGYSKPGQFSADFRKRFGILPRVYRLRR